MGSKDKNFPLVYSCSGCSRGAQTANYIAVQLDKRGVAEMSCIAGLGGDEPHTMQVAYSGRPIIVLDGCGLACARSCLARHGLQPNQYYQLDASVNKKRTRTEFDREKAQAMIDRIVAVLPSAPTTPPRRLL